MISDTEARKSVAMTCAPRKPFHAGDEGGIAFEIDTRAEPRQLLHMHEAVLEDGLAHLAGAVGHAHQRDELRLKIGGEAGEGLGLHRHRAQARRRSAPL